MKAIDLIKKYDGCSKARKWVGDKTIEEAWDTCPRGDWMLWIYVKMYPENKRQLAVAAAHCANTVRHLMTDKRSIDAINATLNYGCGLIDKEALKIYARAASAAADDAVNAADAADAASYASYASYAASYAVSYADSYAASYAADAAANAADAIDAANAANVANVAKKNNLLETANICRKYLTIDFKSKLGDKNVNL